MVRAGYSTPLLAILFALFSLCDTSALAETASEWTSQAREHYHAGQFAESADAYAKAVEAGAEGAAFFYDAACSAARAERIDVAFAYLDEAAKGGWRDVEYLLADSDLDVLHQDPQWNKLVLDIERRRAEYIATLSEPDLYRELLEMRRIDQAIRRGEQLPELAGRHMGDVDAAHSARMKEIIAQYGWPAKSLVGEDGARSAWLLVQHADADPRFQRHCLELMKAMPPGEVSPVDVAYLTDRVLVNEGKKQIYGTQFWSPEGKLVPRPIENEALVETLRAEVGMISMQEYHRRMTGRDWVPRSARE